MFAHSWSAKRRQGVEAARGARAPRASHLLRQRNQLLCADLGDQRRQAASAAVELMCARLKEGAGDAPLDGHALHLRGGVAQELDQVLAHLVLLVR